MSLRKSPRRTRALLTANRRNSRKSTGPRTELGKSHAACNAVRHYRRTQFASCIPIENRKINAFEHFLFNLREAIMPADNAAGTETVLLKAAEVWRVKRSFDRWIETRIEEDWLGLAVGSVPRPRSWRLKLRRPGLSVPDWVVTASVCLRRSRRPTRAPGQSGARHGADIRGGSQWSTTEDNWKPDLPRMHTMVLVHSTGPVGPAEPLEAEPGNPESFGEKPECERTKTESYGSQSRTENMPLLGVCDPDYAAAFELAERIASWFMGWGKRTKPECDRNKTVSENMLAQGGGKIAPGALDGCESHGSPEVSAGNKQTKPECFRKKGAYKNISKPLGWLRATVSSLLKRGSNRRRSTDGEFGEGHLEEVGS